MRGLVFYVHIAKELSTSPFVCNVGCDQVEAISELLVYIRSVKHSRRALEASGRK